MRLPEIIGVTLTGKRQPGITATDIVLALTEFRGNRKSSAAYLEFHRRRRRIVTLGDRATISNMAPEWRHRGDVFIDNRRMSTCASPGRDDEQVKLVETHAKTAGLWLTTR